MKIFIGLIEIAGYYSNLKKGFDQIGIESVFINAHKNTFSYNIENSSFWANSVNNLFTLINSIPRLNLLLKIMRIFLRDMLKILIFPFVLINYNVFIFGFNSSFFYYLDLPIIKLFGKKIIYVFNGSDSRPPYLNGIFKNCSIDQINQFTKQKKQIIKIIENYADHLINNPPQALFHEKKFISELILGLPYDQPKKTEYKLIEHRKTIILHAPSNPSIKGTNIIREAVKKFKKKYSIHYREIVNKSNKEVLTAIRECDLVIDQLYSDTPLASFATESAFCGKLVIVGGYYAEQILKDIPKKYIPPSLFVDPSNFSKTMIRVIKDRNELIRMSQQLQKFVLQNWGAEQVAMKYLKIIEGKIPVDWYFYPKSLNYIFGCGIEKKLLKKMVFLLIKKYGVNVLQLTDKPRLEEKFIKFINRA